jgi:hypothetical protein
VSGISAAVAAAPTPVAVLSKNSRRALSCVLIAFASPLCNFFTYPQNAPVYFAPQE